MKINRDQILKTGRPPVNPFTLSFNSEELQRSFHHYSTSRSLSYVRLTLGLAIFLFLIFGLLDRILLSEEIARQIMYIRIVCTIIFVEILLLTFSRIAKSHLQLLMCLVELIGGTAIVWMVILCESTNSYFYLSALILAIMYGHGLLRLRFIYASMTTWIVIILYEVLSLSIGDIPREIILNNSFFLFSANIMGMFASYWLEYYMRAVFWQTRKLRQQSIDLHTAHELKQKELEEARQIQLGMLPDASPYFPEYEFAFAMHTATEIGGDYYDYRICDGPALTFAIGDATGHGATAGVVVTAIKILFNEHGAHATPLTFLEKASNSLRNVGLRKMYISFAIGLLQNHTIEIAGAGLPPALLYRSASHKIEKIPLKGMPLGSPKPYPYKSSFFEFGSGDTLLLMTDGLPELFNTHGKMFGYKQLEDTFERFAFLPVQQLLEQLQNTYQKWLDGYPQDDDITFFAIKRKGI